MYLICFIAILYAHFNDAAAADDDDTYSETSILSGIIVDNSE